MDKPKNNKPAMEKFYFTYGTDSRYPFQGGWTLICADNLLAAQQIFKAYHPNRDGCDCLNCADFYTEEQFRETEAFKTGNFGARCHEIIGSRLPETGEMETLASRDVKLQELWEQFDDVPVNLETECIEEPFLNFPAGTHRQEILAWFDQRHSTGIAYLLYGDGHDSTEDLTKLAYRKVLCAECDCEECAFQSERFCRFPLVYGKPADYDDHYGCRGFVEKPDTCRPAEEI